MLFQADHGEHSSTETSDGEPPTSTYKRSRRSTVSPGHDQYHTQVTETMFLDELIDNDDDEGSGLRTRLRNRYDIEQSPQKEIVSVYI